MHRHLSAILLIALLAGTAIYIFYTSPSKIGFNSHNNLEEYGETNSTLEGNSNGFINSYATYFPESEKNINQSYETPLVGRSMQFCFEAADLSDRPEPSSKENPTSRWQWKIEHPWVLSLGDEELSQLRSSVYLANWNSSARQAKSTDLAEGKNLELWENQEKLKEQTEFLNVEQSIQSVLGILGEPTKVYRYNYIPNYSEMVLMGKIEEFILSSNQIAALDEPITIHYEPPGYSDRGVNCYFRKLSIDFTADGKLFQWHFDPLPLSSDW